MYKDRLFIGFIAGAIFAATGAFITITFVKTDENKEKDQIRRLETQLFYANKEKDRMIEIVKYKFNSPEKDVRLPGHKD
jgi:hypothetical protein